MPERTNDGFFGRPDVAERHVNATLQGRLQTNHRIVRRHAFQLPGSQGPHKNNRKIEKPMGHRWGIDAVSDTAKPTLEWTLSLSRRIVLTSSVTSQASIGVTRGMAMNGSKNAVPTIGKNATDTKVSSPPYEAPSW